MTEPIDEAVGGLAEGEAEAAMEEGEPESAEQPEEERKRAKFERYLWGFITGALVLSVGLLALSWRAGALGGGDSAGDGTGSAAGLPAGDYGLRVVTADRLSVLSEPRPDAPVIDELSAGQLVRVRLDGGDWQPAVLEDGQIIGWLEAAHLDPVSAEVVPLTPAEGAGALFAPDVERLSGYAVGELPADVPRVTVRLFEDVEAGAPVGSVVYWHESGPCTYSLELLEEADGLMKTTQVPESSSCEPLGEVWFVDGETAMTAIWHRVDGSQWFSSYLTLD